MCRMVSSGSSNSSALPPRNGNNTPPKRPMAPAQPIPVLRISGGYPRVARLLRPVCPPTWQKFHTISAVTNMIAVCGGIWPSEAMAMASTTK